MASYIAYLSDHRNKDNTHTIWMRITMYYEVSKISTDIRIEKTHWNKKKKEVRSSHENYADINRSIDKIKSDLDAIYTEAKSRGKELRASEVKLIYEENKYAGIAPLKIQSGFFTYCRTYFDQLEESGKFHVVRNRRSIINKLFVFMQLKEGEDVAFDKITQQLLIKYKVYLQTIKHNGKNTIHGNLKKIKEQFARANREGIYSGNPFLNLKFEKGKANRVRLNKYEITELETTDILRGSGAWHARNFWLVSYYCAGIRWADICTLMWPMIRDQRLRYNMGKTDHFRSLKLHDKAQKILWEYASDPLRGHAVIHMQDDSYVRKVKSNLIFPILSDVWRTRLNEFEKIICTNGIIALPPQILFELKREINARDTTVNKYLKHVAYLADIKKDITFHTSRHSFADIARKKDISIQKISEMLGHGDIATTQQYFGNGFDDEDLDDTMNEIFN